MVMMPIDYEPPEPRCTVRQDGIANIHDRMIQHAPHPPCCNRESHAAHTHDAYQSGAPLTHGQPDKYAAAMRLDSPCPPSTCSRCPMALTTIEPMQEGTPTSDPYDGEE